MRPFIVRRQRMFRAGAILFLALAATGASALAASDPSPSSAEVAAAVQEFSGWSVGADHVRSVSCARIEEEPTEFACKWRQKVGGRWKGFRSYFALAGSGWQLIDEPAASDGTLIPPASPSSPRAT